MARLLASIGASGFENLTLTGSGGPAQLNSVRVTASFFPTLGVMPAQGRNSTTEEDLPNGPLVCVISYELWQTRFGGQPLIGKGITLNGQSWQMVGIMPPNLTAPFGQVQVSVPRLFEMGGLLNQVRAGVGMAQTIARLRPGVTVHQARDGLAPSVAPPATVSRDVSTRTTPAIRVSSSKRNSGTSSRHSTHCSARWASCYSSLAQM